MPPQDDESILKASGVPARRRMEDLPTSTAELILYQLSEMKAQVREGFARMDGRFEKVEGRFDRVEERVAGLERFRERVEEREKTEAASANTINARWVPIFLAILGVVVTIAIVLLTNGGGA